MDKIELIESLRYKRFTYLGREFFVKQITSPYHGQNYLFGKPNYNFPLWLVEKKGGIIFGQGDKKIVSLRQLTKAQLLQLHEGNYSVIDNLI